MPLAEHLWQSDSSILQPWYAKDFALQGQASRIAKLFHLLCRYSPSVGYFPEMEKCWAICPLSSKARVHQIFDDASLPVNYFWAGIRRRICRFALHPRRMALLDDPEMGHGDQAASGRHDQVPTLCLRWPGLMPKHQMAIHLQDDPRCWA
ncbi:hypothetical protein ACHAW6_001626 [Cyclotella cf. meneghiniana]